LALLLLAASGTAVATSVLERSLATLLQRAELRVYGDVVSVAGERDADGEIWTTVTVEVVRDLDRPDDPDAPATHELRFLGGTLPDGRTAVLDGLPVLEEGDRVLVLAYLDEGLASPVAGGWQGWWRVGSEGLTDREGRVLGLDQGVLRLGGPERDVDAVLDAIEAGAEAGAQATEDAAGDAEADGEDAAAAGEDEAASERAASEADAADPPPAEAPTEEAATDDGTAPAEGVAAREGDAASDAEREANAAGDDAEGAAEETEDADVGAAPIRLRLAAPEDEELRAAVRAAAQAWRDAGADVQLELDEDAADAVRVGPDDWFGPDVLALSRRTPDATGVEILLRPGPEGRRPDVLARELGLLAGLPAGATPVASGLLPVGAPASVRTEDATALARSLAGPAADLTGDGAVDLYDLAALAEAYGQVGTRLPADLDRSGRVDDADVELLREAYEFLPASRDAPPGRRPAEP
jgi:hypothetical protein